MPMFRVEKVPALIRRQGAYRIVAASGAILKRGHELAAVLRILDKPGPGQKRWRVVATRNLELPLTLPKHALRA